MRISLMLSATAAVLLPLAPQAAPMPWAQKKAYTLLCKEAAANEGLDDAIAIKHCECSLAAIEKNFSAKEIEDLNSAEGVDAELIQQLAQAVVKANCKPR